MKRASYRHAIALIALNDGPGDDDALDAEAVSELVSVGIVADLFGVPPLEVAQLVVAYREKSDGNFPKSDGKISHLSSDGCEVPGPRGPGCGCQSCRATYRSY